MSERGRSSGCESRYRSAYLVFLRDSEQLICAGTVDYVADRIGRSSGTVKKIGKRKTYAEGNVMVKKVPARIYVARRAGDRSLVVAGSLTDVAHRLGAAKSSLHDIAKNGRPLQGTDVVVSTFECPNVSVPNSCKLFEENAYSTGSARNSISMRLCESADGSNEKAA